VAVQPQPQPGVVGPAPTPTDECVECVRPDGSHFITTVLNCEAIGGTPFGSPFPCTESDQRSRELEGRQNSES